MPYIQNVLLIGSALGVILAKNSNVPTNSTFLSPRLLAIFIRESHLTSHVLELGGFLLIHLAHVDNK